MKMSFKKIEGSFGIPVYVEQIPEVHSVSMSWTMFVGSADDEGVGAPGLYHWFEHLPFRGTVKYPGGYKATKGYISGYGGHIGAYTSMHATTYHTHVPTGIWREALSTITDLMAEPLLSDEAVQAERDIIFQEIVRKKAALKSFAAYGLPEIVWPRHPFGHPVLGSEETLSSMTPDILRKAQDANYDRSRCALVVSGNIDESELLLELKVLAPLIRARGLSPRYMAASHGQLPAWQKGVVTRVDAKFASSMVLMLFPIPQGESLQQKFKRGMAVHMFAFGSLDAPMQRILREERRLVYSAEITACDVPGGGYWGFCAETQAKNVDAVISALKDLLQDPAAISPQRLDAVKRGLRGSFDIRPLDPATRRDYAVQRLINNGVAYSDDEYLDYVDSLTIEDMRSAIEKIDPRDAHVIVFGAG